MPQPRMHVSHAARQAAYRRRQEHARAQQLRTKGLAPLPAIASMPGNVRWNQAIAHATDLMRGVVDEMQDYYDDRSEEWQEGERAETHQQRIDAVQEVVDTLEAL